MTEISPNIKIDYNICRDIFFIVYEDYIILLQKKRLYYID